MTHHPSPSVAIIGGGPAGLMAAETIAAGETAVHVYDAMPTAGRKLLMAGKGGLNITHSEPEDIFRTRYGSARAALDPALDAFGPAALRDWVHDLGVTTFVGTSGRVFPAEMKAAPLLRAWLRRLRAGGVQFHMRHRWTGWDADNRLCFETPAGPVTVTTDATVLALGGGSWPQLGSDGAWTTVLGAEGVPVTSLEPSNCGFDVPWTTHFRERFAGTPVKPVTGRIITQDGGQTARQGEFVVTATGVEGGLIYALSAAARGEITARGKATLALDLRPDRTPAKIREDASRPRGKNSLANYLRKYLGLDGVKAGLLREALTPADFDAPERLAQAVKALPIILTAPRPLQEAISSAGGVSFAGLDAGYMLRQKPGVFCAGEMLDWDAPTGGYLLTACLATGKTAGQGVLTWLAQGPTT